MPLSLRKACHACSRSKRRCIPQLPSCDRCAKKQIPCRYDLEPVSQGEIPPQRQQDVAGGGSGCRTGGVDDTTDEGFKIVYHSVKSAREAAMIAMANGHSADSTAIRPKMLGTAQLIAWVFTFFSDVVRDAQMGRGTPFVHTHILQQTALGLEKTVVTTTAKPEYFDRLSQIHNLTIQSLILLLNKSTHKSDAGIEKLVHRTFTATHTLWSSPPHHFDDSFTPWESWFTAESIRRSMFAAQILKGLLSFVQTGYATYEPFFEALPFDARAGLWEAGNQEEWQGILERYGGDHVRLKSYHEFVTGSMLGADLETGPGSGSDPGPDLSSEIRLDTNEDGAFQRLLFLCYHCDAGIEYLKGLDNLKH